MLRCHSYNYFATKNRVSTRDSDSGVDRPPLPLWPTAPNLYLCLYLGTMHALRLLTLLPTAKQGQGTFYLEFTFH
jgi:hypothetical protein